MKHRIALFAVLCLVAAARPAHASPGFDFVCFGDDFGASIGFDLMWRTAFVDIGGQERHLPATGENNANEGRFDFADGDLRFSGLAPEGRLMRNDAPIADCYQSRDSQRAMALYGKERPQWSAYDAPGLAAGNVRKRPSPVAERVTGFSERTPVTILENTDQFLDGFFWFRIGWGDGEQGYIWGALLCTDVEDGELNTVVRRCN